MQAQRLHLHQRQHCAVGLSRQPRNSLRCRSTGSSNGRSSAACPSPAETARTIVDITNEAVLCTMTGDARPLGTPVGYQQLKQGDLIMAVAAGSAEAANLVKDGRCSLLVQPITYPARNVASVALQGTAQQLEEGSADAVSSSSSGSPAVTSFKLTIDSCVYYGGLDHAAHGLVIPGEEYAAAEPDILRGSATDLITTWNNDRAEDIYRIVSTHMGVPLIEMQYAELLWLDRLGMYIRTEALGRAPGVTRVPFYRAVLDERDARSVITMAAQMAWDADRKYTPPVPAIFQDAVGASNN